MATLKTDVLDVATSIRISGVETIDNSGNLIAAGYGRVGTAVDTATAGDFVAGLTGAARMVYDQSAATLTLRNSANNAMVTLDPEAFKITIGTGVSNSPSLEIKSAAAGQAFVKLYDGAVEKWEIGKQTDNTFIIYNAAATQVALSVATGSGVNVGSATDAAGLGDLTAGLTGAARMFYDQSAGSLQFYKAAGTASILIDAENGIIDFPEDISSKLLLYSTNYGIGVASASFINWCGAAATYYWRETSSAGATWMAMNANVLRSGVDNVQSLGNASFYFTDLYITGDVLGKGGNAITVGQVGGAGNGATLGVPTFTTAQRDANLTASTGMVIYNSTTATFEGYNGSTWDDLASSAGASTLQQAYDAGSTIAGASALDIDLTAGITIDSTGTISIGGDPDAAALNFGTGAAVKTVTVGSQNTTSATTLQSGTGQLHLIGNGAGANAIYLQSVNGGISSASDGFFADCGNGAVSFTTTEPVTITGSGATSDVDINAGRDVLIDAGSGISLDAAAASNLTVTGSAQSLTLAAAGGGAQQVILSSAGSGTNAVRVVASDIAGGIDIDAGATSGAITLDAGGPISINSSGGALNLGNNVVSQPINIGTGGIRAVTVGSTTTTSSLTLRAGTGTFALTQAGGDAITVGQVGGAGTGSTLGVPSFTTAERDANLVATAGMVIYNSTTATFEGHDGSSWNDLAATGITDAGPMVSTWGASSTTMSGNATLTDASDVVQAFDPNGADRDVNLPTLTTNTPFFVLLNTGLKTLSVKDSGGNLLAYVYGGKGAQFFNDGSATWTAIELTINNTSLASGFFLKYAGVPTGTNPAYIAYNGSADSALNAPNGTALFDGFISAIAWYAEDGRGFDVVVNDVRQGSFFATAGPGIIFLSNPIPVVAGDVVKVYANYGGTYELSVQLALSGLAGLSFGGILSSANNYFYLGATHALSATLATQNGRTDAVAPSAFSLSSMVGYAASDPTSYTYTIWKNGASSESGSPDTVLSSPNYRFKKSLTTSFSAGDTVAISCDTGSVQHSIGLLTNLSGFCYHFQHSSSLTTSPFFEYQTNGTTTVGSSTLIPGSYATVVASGSLTIGFRNETAPTANGALYKNGASSEALNMQATSGTLSPSTTVERGDTLAFQNVTSGTVPTTSSIICAVS